MSQCGFDASELARMPVRLLPAALLAATLLTAPAVAQTAQPSAKAVQGPVQTVLSPAKAPEPTFDEGTALRIAAAMLSYSALEVRGGWPTLPANAKLAPGASGPDVVMLRERLVMTDDLDPKHARGEAYDENVAAGVRRFQARHGLEQTGSVGPKTLVALNVPVTKRLRQLAASLDRLAATDFKFGQRYVVVNLPAAFAEAVVGDKVVRRHVVQVGRPDRPSPMVTTHITTVNLNPTWTVPLGILKKDVIPKMRKDPGYAARMHMKVLDGSGNEVDPHSVDWNSDRAPNFTIRQDSGNWNALGAVRIDMPNSHSVYMHDTNHKEFFSADYRFQSSGCTRVENPRDLAAWVLEETPGWSRKEIDAAIAKGTKLDVKVAHKIPVAWIYLTGWVTRDNTIHFRDDIYGHDDKSTRQLVADLRPPVSNAARASGFVLQSADTTPPEVEQVSYLDSQ
jgi:murein L,D-transpeptidase YcbB/YkuD